MIDRESVLARWSRVKRETAARPAAPANPAPVQDGGSAPAELPPLESLDFSSDFTVFLGNKVEESLKRAALRKLFHSPEFNQMDGLDVYVDDYSRFEPIPEELLRKLTHARDMLFGPARDEPQEAAAVADGAASEPASNPQMRASLAAAEPQNAAGDSGDETDVRGRG